MARDAGIEQRLQQWAQWLTVGDGSGYPTKSTLHPMWSPPSAGMTPTMKVGAPSNARQTHRAVRGLSERLQHTLLLHYVKHLSVAEQASQLQCQPQTIDQRIWQAHRLLLLALSESSSAEFGK